MRKFLTTTAMIALAVAGAGASARAADVKEVQMLHWWTSGGEAAALNVLKQDLSKEGYAWKDVPVAGGGGDAAMTALKAMVAAGNYPTASQMLGYTVLDYAQEGVMGDLTATAKKEGWDKSVPKALQKFAVYNGKWVAAPVNVHSVNWLWINKAVMDKIGGKQPKTFAELIALLDKAKAAGVVPLALGGQNWQEATMFDFDRPFDRRPGILQEGLQRPRRGLAEVRHDEEVLRQPRHDRQIRRPELLRP